MRPGSRGALVERLQERLREMGYDPGPQDGVYGHQTAEAVRDLQRDFGLRVDGIAGPQVTAVLDDPHLKNLRRQHTVAPGESLADAARHLGVSQQLLRRACGLPARRAPAPGQRLVLWERIVVGEVKPGAGQAQGLRTLERRGGLVSAAAVVAGGGPDEDPAARSAVESAAAFGLPVWLTLHGRPAPGLLPGTSEPGGTQRRLHSRRERERFAAQAAAWCAVPAVAGVHLDLGALRFGDGPRFVALARELAELTRAAGKQLLVSVPLAGDGRPLGPSSFGVDWGALAAWASGFVLVPPLLRARSSPPRPLSPAEIRPLVRAACRSVPPWRCLLAVPVGALVVPAKDAPGAAGGATGAACGPSDLDVITYTQALSLAHAARTRPRWEEAAGRPAFRVLRGEREEIVWLENRASFAAKLDAAESCGLAGVYLSAVGEEDGRLWAVLAERWKVHKPHAAG